MIDEKKIILMTKLAIQDKTHGKEDRKITSYYKEDYRYINNFWTRMGILIIIGWFIILDILSKIQKGVDIPENMQQIMQNYMIPYGVILGVVLGVYTLLSTVVYTKKYQVAQQRMKEYEENLSKLSAYEEQLLKEEGGKYDSK